MNTDFQELIALTKLMLLQKDAKEMVTVDVETLAFFKNFAIDKPSFTKKIEAPITKKEEAKIEIPIKKEEKAKIDIPIKKEAKKVSEVIIEIEKKKEEVKKETPFEEKPFTREPFTKIETINLSELFSFFKEKYSTIPFVETYPESLERVQKKGVFTPIIIVTNNETALQKSFLEQLGISLSRSYHETTVVSGKDMEEEKSWDELLQSPQVKYIILTEVTLNSLPNLSQYYREIQNGNRLFLGKTLLFMLPDLSCYFKEPLLKRSLYNSLKMFFQI